MPQKTNKKLSSRPKSKGRRNFELPTDARVFSYLGPRPRMLLPNTGQTYTTVQTYQTTAWMTSSVAIPIFAAEQVSLANFDQYVALTTVFDQYRIDELEVYLTNQGSNLNITNTGELITVVDYDDANALTTIGQALDYANSLVSAGQSCHYRHYVPHIAVAAYNGSFVGFKNEKADWIDASTPQVQHYGFKAAISVTSSAMVFDLTVRAKISFRQIR